MIDSITAEQEAALDRLADEWIAMALSDDDSHDAPAIRRWCEYIYGLLDIACPEVVILGSPMAMMDAAVSSGRPLDGGMTDGIGIGQSSGWTSYYVAMRDIVGVDMSSTGLSEWEDGLRAGVWDTLLYDDIAYVCVRPCSVCTDARGELHSDTGPAIRWRDGYELYYWHGCAVDAVVIVGHGSGVDRTYLDGVDNSETRRAVAEAIGWERYLGLVGATSVDAWERMGTLPSGESVTMQYTLYDVAGDDMPRLLRMESPPLHDGSRPHYIEPVHPGLMTCCAALRWQMMATTPETADDVDAEVASCNASTEELPIEVES